jgi:hypothetical protein
MRKSKKSFLILILFLIMSGGPVVHAEDAYISDVVVTNTKDHLLIYFTVNNCFTPEMDKAIENGITTTFNFFVTLSMKRAFWWDNDVVEMQFSHTIKYNSLKELYEVTLSEGGDKTTTVKSFEEAKKLMAEVVALKVVPLHNLHRGRTYQIGMMAQLDKIELPLHLHNVLFFLSLWDFETDWKMIEFRY